MKRIRKNALVSLILLTAFALWTLALRHVDVQPIGPQGSSVGFAAINQFVHDLTGVHFALYEITDWLGLIPIGVCMGFAALGLFQWVQRKNILKVDRDLLLLGGFYLVVIAAYVFFEVFILNYRPVLIDGALEASYPSSTTMLSLCVMLTARIQIHSRIKKTWLKRFVSNIVSAFTLFMVLGRLVSGVHWFSDIAGGILLSAGLVAMYCAFTGIEVK